MNERMFSIDEVIQALKQGRVHTLIHSGCLIVYAYLKVSIVVILIT